jgi:hypothetical protein
MTKYLPDLKKIVLIDVAAPGHGPNQGGGDETVYSEDDLKRMEITQVGWAVIFPRIRAMNAYSTHRERSFHGIVNSRSTAS